MIGLLAPRFSDRFIRHRLDLHFRLQGLVDGTPIGDFDQALALFVRQISFEREGARDTVYPAASFGAARAIIQVYPVMAEPYLDVFEIRLLAVCIHAQRHGGA